MTRKENIYAGLIFLFILTVGILVFTLFQQNKKQDRSYQDKIRMLDSLAAMKQLIIDSKESEISLRDSIIAGERLNNEALRRAYQNNRPIEQKIIHNEAKIPDIIRALDKDALRRAIAEE